MLEQAAQVNVETPIAGLQRRRVEVVGLVAEGEAQALERTDQVLDVGAGEGVAPRERRVSGHAAPYGRLRTVPRPESNLVVRRSAAPPAAQPREEICCTAQALPSGSLKNTNPTLSSGCPPG
jgi:hypothetical protein